MHITNSPAQLLPLADRDEGRHEAEWQKADWSMEKEVKPGAWMASRRRAARLFCVCVLAMQDSCRDFAQPGSEERASDARQPSIAAMLVCREASLTNWLKHLRMACAEPYTKLESLLRPMAREERIRAETGGMMRRIGSATSDRRSTKEPGVLRKKPSLWRASPGETQNLQRPQLQ